MQTNPAPLFRILNSTIFFALAFNAIYFLHEFGLLVAGTVLGNDPVLYHDNMNYFVLARGIPMQGLFPQKKKPPISIISPRTLRFINGRWFDGQSFAPKTFYSIDGILQANHDGAVDTTVDEIAHLPLAKIAASDARQKLEQLRQK